MKKRIELIETSWNIGMTMRNNSHADVAQYEARLYNRRWANDPEAEKETITYLSNYLKNTVLLAIFSTYPHSQLQALLLKLHMWIGYIQTLN